MKTLNFNQPIVGLDGIAMKKTADKELLMKEIVANTLCIAKANKNDDVVRQLNLAMEIYKSVEPMIIEDADIKLIREVLITADLSTLVLGQIIKLIDETERK
jgi:hypothetical protein